MSVIPIFFIGISIPNNFCLFNLALTEKAVLKIPTLVVDLSISYSKSIIFCLMYLCIIAR